MENFKTNELKCYCCQSGYNENDSFCGICGYPFHASPEEQKQFSINYSLNKFEKSDIKTKVKEARIVLFVLAAFTFLWGIIFYFQQDSVLLLTVNVILSGIYAGLGFWAKQKAFAAIFTGALIYISIILLNGIFEPITIFQGIIFKVIFIIAFIKASYGAYKFKIDKA